MTEPTGTTAPETVATSESAGTTETDWKAEARKWEQRAKDNKKALDEAEPIVKQWRSLEEASKTDLEKAQQEIARWQDDAQQWRGNAVQFRVQSLAGDFADPTDALAVGADPSKYLSADGQINDEAIKSDLAALLEQKPHWRRSTGQAGTPAPNRSQGTGGSTTSTDPAQQFASIMQGLSKGS